jgi:ATP adenylyltransferase
MPNTSDEFPPEGVEAAASFAAAPDAFQRLWTPHRLVYIEDGQQPAEHDCPFCNAPTMPDEKALIVARGEHAYVLLNLYPYNSGHLLVCPYRHIATYDQASPEEVAEIGSLTQIAMRVLRETSSCDGFNLGMNQGRIAGAGIAEHLHQHIVPRWARLELLPHHRQDQGRAAAVGRGAARNRRRLAAAVTSGQRTCVTSNCMRGCA